MALPLDDGRTGAVTAITKNRFARRPIVQRPSLPEEAGRATGSSTCSSELSNSRIPLRFCWARRKRNGGEVNLFGRHFRELGDRDFDRVSYPLEISRVGRLIPVEEMRLVDEVLHYIIFPTTK